jgi:hypothetical protein
MVKKERLMETGKNGIDFFSFIRRFPTKLPS